MRKKWRKKFLRRKNTQATARRKNVLFLRFIARTFKMQEVENQPQEAARTYESYHEPQQSGRSCCRSHCPFVYIKWCVGGRNAQRSLELLSIRQVTAVGRDIFRTAETRSGFLFYTVKITLNARTRVFMTTTGKSPSTSLK